MALQTTLNSSSTSLGRRLVSSTTLASNRLSHVYRSFYSTNNMPPVYEKPTTDKYDYVVIGGGSGGSGTSRRAASYGKKVAVVEATPHLGGTCVNVGKLCSKESTPSHSAHYPIITNTCPSQLMWHAADLQDKISHHSTGYKFGDLSKVKFDWKSFKPQRDAYIRRLNGIYANNFDREGVEYHQGFGRLVSPNEVEVTLPEGKGKYTLKADKICVAVGGRPVIPSDEEIPGASLGIDSDGFFDLEEQPKRVAVIGAGYIAVELAGIFNALGTETHLLIRGDTVLRTFDPTIQETLTPWMAKTGVNIHTKTQVTRIDGERGQGLTVHTNKGEKIQVDVVLWAIGRRANTDGLGLEQVGVQLDSKGDIIVDEYQNSNVPGILSIGDVTGKWLLTPVAIAAGRRLANRLFGPDKFKEDKLSYEDIPTVVFSHPPIGTVGLTEPQARKKYGDDAIKIYKASFRSLYFSMVEEEHKEPTVYKLIVAGPEERVVGVHIIGVGSDEAMQGFGVAVKMGARKQDLDDTVAIHPTSAEASTQPVEHTQLVQTDPRRFNTGSLNADILHEIFSFLSCRSPSGRAALYNATLSSRALHSAANRHLWKHPRLLTSDVALTKFAFGAILSSKWNPNGISETFGQHTRSIHLQEGADPCLSRFLMATIGQLAPNVTALSLTLSSADRRAVEDIVVPFTRLNHLELSVTSNRRHEINDTPSFNNVSHKTEFSLPMKEIFGNLTSLCLTKFDLYWDMARPHLSQNLVDLVISSKNLFNQDDVECYDRLAQLTSLVSLEINCPTLSPDLMTGVLSSLSKLERLTLRGESREREEWAPDSTYELVRQALHGLPALREFWLSWGIPIETLAELIMDGPTSLEDVRIRLSDREDSEEEVEEVIISLIQEYCESLRVVVISRQSGKKLTVSEGLLEALACAPSLERILLPVKRGPFEDPRTISLINQVLEDCQHLQWTDTLHNLIYDARSSSIGEGSTEKEGRAYDPGYYLRLERRRNEVRQDPYSKRFGRIQPLIDFWRLRDVGYLWV
ncbi:hypothetical protein CVT24_009008 [Panaeolus cyanescens]|uniref:Glutathione reductase n=1 Tax=Panaeolus cyanescens TaxID=181874 RepID=A0A409YAM6_9AGAR|nr:hypothetical protein CVT24_009008 [Panaeolus cyanescens]